jgi:hypothetical protein
MKAERFWTVGDIAKEARRCTQWVRLREQAGKIKGLRTVGGLRLYRDEDVQALLRSTKAAGQEVAR